MPDVPGISIEFKLLILRLNSILIVDVSQSGLIVDRVALQFILFYQVLNLHFGEGVVAHDEGEATFPRELDKSDLVW